MDDIDEGGFALCNPKRADCGRGLTCERIHYKGDRTGLHTLDLSCNLDGQGLCPYYLPRAAIADQKYLFGAGKAKRHNAHAPARAARPREPDLMVTRHLKRGKDIKDDD
jgi:hypothetical protein